MDFLKDIVKEIGDDFTKLASDIDDKMNLPITEKELNIIIDSLKNKHPDLYNKLWSYRINLKHPKNEK